jgi:hypothetical protein
MATSENPDGKPPKKGGGLFGWMYTENPVDEEQATASSVPGPSAQPIKKTITTENEPVYTASQPVVCDPKDVKKLFSICVPASSALDKFMKTFDSLEEFIPDTDKRVQAAFKANSDIDGPSLVGEIKNTYMVKLETEKTAAEGDISNALARETSEGEKQIKVLGKEISQAEALIEQKLKEIEDIKVANVTRTEQQQKLGQENNRKKEEFGAQKTRFHLAYEAVKGQFEKIQNLLSTH